MREDLHDALNQNKGRTNLRVLIVNYRYFISGGPERYMFNIKDKLEREGHEVIPFSILADKNEETPYSRYFVEPIGGTDQTYFEDYKKTPKTILQMIGRSIYSFRVKRAIKKIISEVNPDVVYILHFVNKLSPSVITGAKQMGKRVVVRLSDYYLLCPRFDFMYENRPCEACQIDGYSSCIKRKCVKESRSASLIRVAAMMIHKTINVYSKVDAFVCPSRFLMEKLVEYGFPAEKVHNVLTFTEDPKQSGNSIGEYGLYMGRITEEKGVESLVQAYKELGHGYRLKIVADDSTAIAGQLKEYVRENSMDNVEFLGFKSGEELRELVRDSRFVCVPSIWYENIPNTILEAHANGKPVLCSRIGSLTELIDEGYNGFLFEPLDSKGIADCVRKLDDEGLVLRISENARESFEKKYTEKVHYEKLIDLLEVK